MKTVINTPHERVVDYLKIRNKDTMQVVAGEYFGSKYTYAETFKMIENYKKAFIKIDGLNEDAITICTPSTIASVNAFYGAIDANKVVNLMPPGFLIAYTEKYMKGLGSKTLFIFDGFLSDSLIDKLYAAGVKNVIVTSITDYMNPAVKLVAVKKGMVSGKSFIDEYLKSHKSFPDGMRVLSVKELVKIGAKDKNTYSFEYKENKLTARFLTGATTSQFPKCVKISNDGLNNMALIYDKLWFDFEPGDKQTVFIPLFYATGAIHSIHAGFFDMMTLVYKPKYDRFAFGKDLIESKGKIALVAPSHVSTLDQSGLADNSLSHVKYVFIGGEAIMPAQMEKFRKSAKRLGIKYILNGYGMTETGSMSGMSLKDALDDSDVTIEPVPGVSYRIVDRKTGEVLPDNARGILQVQSPCATLGYLEKEKDKILFTEDGWINTGDVAVRYSNGRYRVFGRENDYFENKGKSYAMFDIEEKILELDEVTEAEVTKFKIDGEEYPAAVVVLKPESKDEKEKVLKEIYNISVDGIKYLYGVKFIDNFKTNPVTSKRDYLSLANDMEGYYTANDANSLCI